MEKKPFCTVSCGSVKLQTVHMLWATCFQTLSLLVASAGCVRAAVADGFMVASLNMLGVCM